MSSANYITVWGYRSLAPFEIDLHSIEFIVKLVRMYANFSSSLLVVIEFESLHHTVEPMGCKQEQYCLNNLLQQGSTGERADFLPGTWSLRTLA